MSWTCRGANSFRNCGKVTTLECVAVRASREVLIDAPPEAILDALADIEAAPSWSPMHKRVEIIDKYDDGRPRHVKAITS